MMRHKDDLGHVGCSVEVELNHYGLRWGRIVYRSK